MYFSATVVIDHPEPRENVWCETDKQDIPVGREEMPVAENRITGHTPASGNGRQ